jgi:hypothetical protein
VRSPSIRFFILFASSLLCGFARDSRYYRSRPGCGAWTAEWFVPNVPTELPWVLRFDRVAYITSPAMAAPAIVPKIIPVIEI